MNRLGLFLLAGIQLYGMPIVSAQSPDLSKQTKTSATTPAPTQRIRELVYFFRHHRVFSRDEEWAMTIRELVEIGKPAVPELIAELERTDRDATLRSLGFTLRAIGDPRAVPALIRAIPKTLRPPGSDCGIGIVNPELHGFMKRHQKNKGEDSITVGRPVNEILSALERITNHREPDDQANDGLRGFFLGGTTEQQAQKRQLFEKRKEQWQKWWSNHWQEFVTKEELQSVESSQRDVDVVEAAAVAKYGPLFPTGSQIQLGPVHMLRLDSSAYWNGKSYIDFDTGRLYENLQDVRVRAEDWHNFDNRGPAIKSWYRQKGIDARRHSFVDGVDLYLWLIDNSRWYTIEAEIKTGNPLALGTESTSSWLRNDSDSQVAQGDELTTFLFTTREGGRGIVQVFPKDTSADQIRVRYRMWITANGSRTAQQKREFGEEKPQRTEFGNPITTSLEMAAPGKEFLLDLETGKKSVAPEFLRPVDLANVSSLSAHKQFREWCWDQRIDLIGQTLDFQEEKGARPKSRAALQFVGREIEALRILPQTFDELSVEEVREILDRYWQELSATWLMSDASLSLHPDTFAFRTADRSVGLLQFEEKETGSGKLTIRYRLRRAD